MSRAPTPTRNLSPFLREPAARIDRFRNVHNIGCHWRKSYVIRAGPSAICNGNYLKAKCGHAMGCDMGLNVSGLDWSWECMVIAPEGMHI